MLQLTNENYYSLEANLEYMSHSQYENFINCEAQAVAKLNGWQEKKNKSMLVGSFVHAAIESEEAFEKFKKANPDMFLKDGITLKADFAHALKMIDVLKNDRLIQLALDGEKEKIITAKWAGCWWKAKIDVLNHKAGRLTDLKTARSLSEKVWDSKSRSWMHFVEAYGYIRQMALYLQIESIDAKRDYFLDPYMVIVTSEDPPDKMVISFDPIHIETELQKIQDNLSRVLAVKSGIEKPKRCEKCAYCRETKQLDRVIDFDELYPMYVF